MTKLKSPRIPVSEPASPATSVALLRAIPSPEEQAELPFAGMGFAAAEFSLLMQTPQTEQTQDQVLMLQRHLGNQLIQTAIDEATEEEPQQVAPETKTASAPRVSPPTRSEVAGKEKPPDTKAALPAAKGATPPQPTAAKNESIPPTAHPREPAAQPTPAPPGTATKGKTQPPSAAPLADALPGQAASLAKDQDSAGAAGSAGKPAPRADADAAGVAADGMDTGAFDVSQWQGRVVAAAASVPPKRIAGGKGTSLTGAAKTAASKRDDEAKKLPDDGSKATTPPKDPKDLPAIPEDTSKAALQLVEGKSKGKLKEVTLPALAATPLGHIPEIGKEPVKAAAAPGAKPGAKLDAAVAGDAPDAPPKPAPQANALQLDPAAKKTPAEGATITDQPPPVLDVPAASAVDIGPVVARLLAEDQKHADKIVDDARTIEFRGVPDEVRAGFGEGLKKDEVAFVDGELHRLAEAAGVGEAALKTMVDKRREELAASKKEGEKEVAQSLVASRKQITDSSVSYLQTLSDTRDSLERTATDRVAAVKGDVDVAKIRKDRDHLIAVITEKVAGYSVSYESASKAFKDALDREMGSQIRAYQVAAREDEEQLNAGADTDEKKKAALVAYRPTKYWLDERLSALRKDVEIKKVAADNQTDTFQSELQKAGSDAREQIREWAAARQGYQRSWFQRILDWISDWLEQAKAESEAWAKQRAAENKAAVDKDTLFLDAEVDKLSKMTKEEVEAEVLKLNEEQFAIVQAYFTSGGDRIAAVAAGLITHISVQRRPELLKKLEEEVVASTDFDKVNAVAKAQDPGFSAATKSDRLHDAFAGPGTTEELVFSTLSGLTAVQAHAVELQYGKDYAPETLRDRLKSELDDWATWSKHDIDRANAMMAGDDAGATAIQLDQAMHGNWNGLDLGGTDEDTIFAALRNKSPAQIAAIKKAYREKFGKDLEGQLEGELNDWFVRGTHDVERMQALMQSDSTKADTVAIDKAMHGGWLGWGLGTDRQAIEEVYAKQDEEAQLDANAKGWDTPKLKEEIRKRHAAIDRTYEDRYGKGFTNLKPGEQSALSAAYKDELSGAELRLVTGLHEQNSAMVDAARVSLEHTSVLYADDKVINKAVQNQYTKEFTDKRRDLNLELDEQIEADRKNDRPGSFKTWTPEKIREERKRLDRKAEEYASGACVANFDKVEQEYNDHYKNQFSFFGGPSLGFKEDILADTQFAQHDKAEKLIQQKGYLTDVQEIRYGIQGAGTDKEAVQGAFKGKNANDVADLKKRWDADPDNTGKGSLDEWMFGGTFGGDFSGRDQHEMEEAFLGEAETPQEKLAKAERDLAFETDSTNWFAKQELTILKGRVDDLKKEVQTFEALEKDKERPDFNWEKYAQAQGEVDSKTSEVDSAIESHRKEVDVVSETATQIIGAVVTAVIVAVSIIMDVVTVGGATVATPAEAGAVSAIWTMLGISIAGTALTMVTKRLLTGSAYGWEDAGADLALGLVDALMTIPTAGMGGKLLKGSQFLGKLAERKIFGKMLANFLVHAAEGAVMSTPGALLGSAMNKQNYEGGNAVLNILEGAAVQVAGAAVMSGGVGALHAVIQADLVKVRTDPEYQKRVFEKFQAKNPNKTKADFLANLDGLIMSRTTKGFEDPRLQAEMRAQVLEHLPSGQKTAFADVPIDVLSEDQFKRFTRSGSGKAAAIFVDGKPRIIVKAGTDFAALGEEGIHLLQSRDPATAAKIRKLDESTLQHWDTLDLDTQLDLYRTKVELEIDAHQRLLESLEGKKAGAADPQQLLDQIERAKANLSNLHERLEQVNHIAPEERLDVATGVKPKPQFLDQPSRLFAKDPTLPMTPVDELRATVRGKHTEPPAKAMKNAEADLRTEDRVAYDALQRARKDPEVHALIEKAIRADEVGQAVHLEAIAKRMEALGMSKRQLQGVQDSVTFLGKARAKALMAPKTQQGRIRAKALAAIKDPELRALVAKDPWVLGPLAERNPEQLLDLWKKYEGSPSGFRAYTRARMVDTFLPIESEMTAAFELGQRENLRMLKEPDLNPKDPGTDIVGFKDNGEIWVIDDKAHRAKIDAELRSKTDKADRSISVSSVSALTDNLAGNMVEDAAMFRRRLNEIDATSAREQSAAGERKAQLRDAAGSKSDALADPDLRALARDVQRQAAATSTDQVRDVVTRYEQAGKELTELTRNWKPDDYTKPAKQAKFRKILEKYRVRLFVTSAMGDVTKVSKSLARMGIKVIPSGP